MSLYEDTTYTLYVWGLKTKSLDTLSNCLLEHRRMVECKLGPTTCPNPNIEDGSHIPSARPITSTLTPLESSLGLIT